MAQRIIKLNEQDIKEIVRQSLNEMTRAEFENIGGDIIKPKHTERAFAVGDVLARYKTTRVKDDEGNVVVGINGSKKLSSVGSYNTIIGIENGILKLDDGSKFNPKGECCTDVWFKIMKLFGEGANGFSFDYQMIDGELWVIVECRFGLANRTKYRYRHEDVKNASLNQPIKGIKMDANENMTNTMFWIKEGEVTPVRSKNPMPDRIPVPKQFICYTKKGASFGGNNETFGAWNFEEAKNICTEYGWLFSTPSKWSLPTKVGEKNLETLGLKKNQCTPKEFSQWLQTQTETRAFVEYVKNKKTEKQ